MELLFPVWIALSLPVLALFWWIYTRTRGIDAMWHRASKCGATFIALMTAVFGAVFVQKSPESWILVLAIALCCIGDFLIERSLVQGIVGFAAAHAAFIAYMLLVAPPQLWSLPLTLVFYGLIVLLFRRNLKNLGSMLMPLVLYPLVLSTMAALAVPLPFTLSPQYAVFAVGALAFAVSDMFVAKDAISDVSVRQKNGALLLYYLAVYAMASVLLLS